MQQQLSVITVGVRDLAESRRFYTEGFGWVPIFENEEIAFYQMNGLVFGTYLKPAMKEDLQRHSLLSPGPFVLTHIVREREAVQPLVLRLEKAGGRILRQPGEPVYGGYRGYVADPDDHSWEVAWNDRWSTDERGSVQFSI